MTGILFVLAGCALFLLVLLLLRAEDDAQEELRLPGREVMDRILAHEDAAFVARLGDARIRRLFTQERRRLALAWVRQNRLAASRLIEAHARGVRQAGDLRPLTEIRLAAEFAGLVLVCAAVTAQLRLFGPFGLRGGAGAVNVSLGVLDGLRARIAADAGGIA